jgi:hypothetical protein
MKKNVSGQRIGAQMVSASDGSAFTGAVTVYVTGDAGTQAAGSVGSGACTHEGNGYHTYAPAQAETNYDLAAFTFVGSGAVPTTVQVYTSYPQSVDHAASIAAIKAVTDVLPDSGALTSLATAAALATVDGTVDAILLDTAEIGVAGAGLTALASASALATVATYVDTEVAAIKAVTDLLPDAGALTSLATASALATVDTVVDAIKVTTDKLDDTLEDDGGTYRFSVNALEQAPSGTGASAAAIAAAMFTTDTGETESSAVAGSVVYEIVQNAGGGTGLDAAGVRAAIGMASANLDTQLGGISSKTTNLPSDPADQSLIIDATNAIMSRLGTPAGASVSADVAAAKVVVDAILLDTAEIGAAGAGLTALASASALSTVDGIVDAILLDTAEIGAAGAGLTALASASSVSDVDTVVDAIKAKTDSLTFTVAGQVRSDVRYVNGTQVTGNGSPGTEWGPI